MKKYHVWKYINGEPIIGWRFKTLGGAKAFFDAKVSELPVYRKRKNQRAFKKLHDTDCCSYELYIEDDDTHEFASMSWKEAKKAK